MVLINERVWNNWNNDGTELLLQMRRSHEAHSFFTRRLRSFGQEQKDKSAGSGYFMHVPKGEVVKRVMKVNFH